MFRKPREAASPSVGKTPESSPPLHISNANVVRSSASAKKESMAGLKSGQKANTSILNFFKRAPLADNDDLASSGGLFLGSPSESPVKRRKLDEDIPTFPEDIDESDLYSKPTASKTSAKPGSKPTYFVGPFVEDLDEQDGAFDDAKIRVEAEPLTDKVIDEAYDDDFEDGEEFLQMRWMERQNQLEMLEDFERAQEECEINELLEPVAACPLCSKSLAGLTDEDATMHVNLCLDGPAHPAQPELSNLPNPVNAGSVVKSPLITERSKSSGKNTPNPHGFIVPDQPKPLPSMTAFTKLMNGNAEDAAWAAAAAEEVTSRGKQASERTCPFYKIMPGMFICVDAFRYGAVSDCRAYFLSHFHSDHYIGLTHTWNHGPIYCSRVTANLVRQQLRVDPQYVVDLEFEQKQPVPGTEGVFVTMINANHCPGSSLFLFEKIIGQGKTPKVQRILHCGDFRASPTHIRHPKLRPETIEDGKTVQQKLDVCYLDTTYLNPKYAFPEQQEVIRACADMCVNLNNGDSEPTPWDKMKIVQPLEVKAEPSLTEPKKDRLLVVIGTYSIGKERICLGIAKALNSKIYASAGKARICACLEDPELDTLLTRDPTEAQVHMTPLMEIRAETLQEYLEAHKPHFTRVVGFRPSGWTYRPPTGRFIESPSVKMVLSDTWVSRFSINDLAPQRGSTKEAKCFGVPYSEHSSFRELSMFCCALRIDRIIPTVNIGSAKSREKMKTWIEKWAAEKKKNGLYSIPPQQASWYK